MILTAHDLVVRLGDRTILHGVDLRLETGEFVGLIGPNGAGKSTLLRALAGTLPRRGTLVLEDRPLAGYSVRERARRIGYLAQDRHVAWPLTVTEVVGLGRLPHRAPFSRESDADRLAVARALRITRLEDLAGRRADALSGGEVARMLLARLIAQETPVLLADEPVAGLDPAHQLATMQVFADFARAGHTVFASLHDLTLAARWCHRLVLMAGGRIVAQGPPETVLTPERIAEIYGIEARVDRNADGLIVVPLRLVGHHHKEAT
ncbi:MAG: hmuV [Proteobacteria bacterium]|nr:hmuV [Pseudomonadota bacterium]